MENTDHRAEGSAPEREYIAFISYRHLPLDTKAAMMIQQRIEHYKVPKEYREKSGIHPGIVFRDEDELPVSPSLSDSIVYALDHSQYLIVICTKNLKESEWCNAEISYFVKKYGRDRVIAVLVDGTPEESFPPQLLHSFDENGNITDSFEPLAANLAGGNGTINKKAVSRETTRIVAALLGCPFDTLWQREKRRRMNRILLAMGAAVAILAVFLGMMIRKNAQISAQNEEISRQNLQISEQNRELAEQLSTALVDSGRAKLEQFDVRGALQDGLDALLEGDENREDLYDRRAETLLVDALGAYRNEVSRSSILYRQSSDIVFLTVSDNGQYAYLSDRAGVVNCVDIETGELCWTVPSAASGQDPGDNDPALFVLEEQGLLLCKNTASIRAVSLENGETVWEYQYLCSGGNNFRGLSPDEKVFLIVDAEEPEEDPHMLVALDTGSGKSVGQTDLASPEYEIDLTPQTDWYHGGCTFTEDGSTAVVALYEKVYEEDKLTPADYQCMFFLIDCETWEMGNAGWIKGLPFSTAGIVYGMHYMPETENLFVAVYVEGVMISDIFDWGNMTSHKEFTNQMISSPDGMSSYIKRYTVQPMLADEHIVIVFSDNEIFVFDRQTAEANKILSMEGKILYAWWTDKEQEKVAFLMDNGQVGIYDFEHEDTALNGFTVYQYDQDDMLLAVSVNGGICTDPDNGMYLTVSRKEPGLLKVRHRSDPGLQELSLPEDTVSLNVSVQSVPSGDKVLIFCPTLGSKQLTVIAYDAETGEETDRRVFETEDYYLPVVLDDTHFISGCQIYDLETGTARYLEGLTKDSPGSSYPVHYRSIRLSDGSVLTVEDLADDPAADFGLCSCWLNGKLLPGSEDLKTGIALPGTKSRIYIGYLDYNYLEMGRNGLVLAHGVPWEEGAQEDLSAKDPQYIVFDTASQERRLMEDPFPQDENRIIAMGTQTPVFACAYSNGQIRLFDPSTGSCDPFDVTYLAGEIQSFCFSEGDEYLLVLTMGARLDVYDLSDGSLVLSEVLQDIKARNARSKASYGIFSRLSCQMDPEQNRMHVYASVYDDTDSYWTCIDTHDWVITAHAQEIYGWIPESNGLYAWETGNIYLRYPMYSLEDLAAWARAELAK